ncbi:MAG: hypothetical protein LBT21_01475 [Oscillospiraceae bacterium]|nr:hypothetical protein [Oscillospiraceae bacterium]
MKIVKWGMAETGEVSDYVDNEFSDNPNTKEKSIMPLKLLVEHFKIPREKFDEYVEHMKSFYKELIDDDYYIDLNSEEYEIPNADIIYTFDDEIINNYYRRQ